MEGQGKMIVKILTRNSPSYISLINYIIDGSKDKDSKPHIITHNLRSETIVGYEQEFIENEALRKSKRSDRIYMYHEIISLSANEDNSIMTDALLNDLALRYISLRGNNGLFIGAIHRDKEHIHIHFMAGGSEFKTGKAFRLTKAELHDLKIKLQEFHREKYPQIAHSFPEHGKGKVYATDREWQQLHRDERKSIKGAIQKTVSKYFKKAQTQKEFLELLRDEQNLHFYERAGIATGLVLDSGIKIRFSRLGISKEHFLAKPPDKTDEMETLSRIRDIREKSRTHIKDRSERNI